MKGSRGKKAPYVSDFLLTKIEKIMASGKKLEIKTYDRRSTIIPKFIGFNFLIYNGKNFIPLFISEEMIGYKLGDFVLTRIFKAHGGDKAGRGKAGKTGKVGKTGGKK